MKSLILRYIALAMPRYEEGEGMDKIIFYDGECGLCQRSVRFLANIDKKKELFFAPLNGETYKKYFTEKSDLTTVTFFSKNQLFLRSDAIIEVFKGLGGVKKWVAITAQIIPRFIRDGLYRMIASQRRKVSCTILVRDQRFLK